MVTWILLRDCDVLSCEWKVENGETPMLMSLSLSLSLATMERQQCVLRGAPVIQYMTKFWIGIERGSVVLPIAERLAFVPWLNFSTNLDPRLIVIVLASYLVFVA